MIVEQNFGLLGSRWPALARRIEAASPPGQIHWITDTPQPTLEADGLRLWSGYDPEGEAQLQAEAIPADASHAWVYGIGGGDLIRALLQRPAITRLHIVPLNHGLARLLLTELDQRDWLGDPRVELHDFHDLTGMGTPFAVVPACTRLAEPEAEGLGFQINLEIDSLFNRERRSWEEGEWRRRIEDDILPLLEVDGDVATLFGTREGGSGFVVLSGPSLKKRLSWLRRHRPEGTLIAVDGSLQPLLAAGIDPDVVVTADSKADGILPYFEGDLTGLKSCPLVYLPVTPVEALRRWPGPRLSAYTRHPFFAPYQESHPKGSLFMSGTVALMATDLAVRMGLRRIFLIGADFGFPGDQIHANDKAPVEYYRDLSSGAAVEVVDGWGRKIRSLSNFRSYLLDLEQYIAAHPSVEFIDTCRDGAHIAGTRYLDPEP